MTAAPRWPRVGQGVDVHAFVAVAASDAASGDTDVVVDAARRLVLGGVVIDDATPLAGHSDADVVLHSLVDAMLGSVAAGDLGSLVGVDRPEVAGADSSTFVTQAVEVLADRGYRVGQCDVTVIAQRPRLSAHVPTMRSRIAALLDLDVADVSVKATTTDRLGFVGRAEGIAAMALVTAIPVG